MHQKTERLQALRSIPPFHILFFLAGCSILVCSASAKLFVDFVADDYEAKEITTDAKSFYERRKALEKKKREEEEKAAENTVIDVEM